MTILAFAGFLVAGFGLSQVAVKNKDPFYLGRLSLLPAAAFGLVGIGYFTWRAANYASSSTPLYILVALAVALGATSASRSKRSASPSKYRPCRSIGTMLLAALALAACLNVAIRHDNAIRLSPYGGFDAVAIWNAHAVFIYRTQYNLYSEYRKIEKGHPEYPLALPATVAALFEMAGKEDIRLSGWLQGSFLAGLALATLLFASRLGTLNGGFVALALLFSTPSLSLFFTNQGADLPVAYLTLICSGGLASLIEAEDSAGSEIQPWALGACAGVLAFTKNEGVVLAGLIVGIAFLFLGARRRWRSILGVSVGLLPGFLALAWFKAQWVSNKEAGRFFANVADVVDLDRWAQVLSVFGRRLLPWTEKGDRAAPTWILLVLAIIVYLLQSRRDDTSRDSTNYLAITFVVSLLIYLSFYTLSPYPLRWHIDSSIDRLMLQLLPILLLATVVMANRRERRETDK